MSQNQPPLPQEGSEPEEWMRKLRRSVFGSSEHFAYSSGKVFHSCARNNDGIAPAVCLLGDTQEFTAIVFPELDVEMLALDLEFFGLDDMIHLKSAVYRPEMGE
jgi:hypothetical protein